MTSPRPACSCRRAATFTGSPTTSSSAALTTTSPVLIPTRRPKSSPRPGRPAMTASKRTCISCRGPHRPQGVVLADVRHAEHRHHAVAEELHDRAAVVVDRAPHRRVVAVHQLAGRLRVEPLLERGRAGEVGEHDRDDLAGVVALRRRRRGQRRPAGIAEPRALTVRPATVVTRHPGPPSAPDPFGRC